MIVLRFGDFPIDMRPGESLEASLLEFLQRDFVLISPDPAALPSSASRLVFEDNGALLTITGSFSFVSPDAFLDSRITGMVFTLPGGDLLMSITSLPSFTLEQFLISPGSVIALLDSAALDILGSRFDDILQGGLGGDLVRGGEGGDTLVGLAGNDRLFGGDGNDVLDGGSGDDLLDGGTGDDSMEGGVGDDVFIVDSAGDTVTDSAGKDTVQTGLVAYTLAAGIENLTLTGAGGQAGTGNEAANVIRAGGFGDTLIGLGGDDRLIGGAGGDTLDGGAGVDAMTGRAGDDTYIVGDIGDLVTETTAGGIDTVVSTLTRYTLPDYVEHLVLGGDENISGRGNTLNNTIIGNAGDNTLEGRGGADVLVGGEGDDRLIGGAGSDTLAGGAGDDVYVTDARDTVQEAEGEGTDTVFSAVSHTLAPNVENLVLTGLLLANGTGNELDNSLIGNDVANTLDGGAGDDFLNGGLGRDVLLGGEGDDRFVYDPRDTRVDGGIGEDTLVITRSGFTLDLSLVPDDRITGIDVIDLTGTGNNILRLTVDDVTALTDSGVLRVDGDAGDQVVALDAGWVAGGAPVDIGGVLYASYTNGAATLLVDADLDVGGTLPAPG